MILNDFTEPRLKFSRDKLDAVLAELCGLLISKQRDNPDFYGMVAAAVVDPKGQLATGVNYLYGNYRVHAERAAIDRYEDEYGKLPRSSIVVTTLSPCSQDTHDNRYEESCTDLLNSKRVKLAYCGYKDPTQDDKNDFTVIVTDNGKIKELCKRFADTFLDDELCENFADGKVKGKSRPGRVKKAGASCKGSVADLRSKAKHSSGERAKMYHWCANMKSGKKKTNEDKSFNQCYATACKLYDQAEAKGLEPLLVQVAGYQGDGSQADPKWLKMPQEYWQHYVTIVGDTVLDPTADQFGPGKPTKYTRSQLDAEWNKQYQIRPKELDEVIHHPGIKTKHADTSGLVNRGEPVPPGKEKRLLGTKVGNLGELEVYKWDKGTDSAYSVYDPRTRISQMTISGHNKAHHFEIFGIYGGPKSPIRAADLYAWLVKKLGLTLVSDKYQSPGGQRVWQELEQRYGRSVNVYAFNMRTNQPINTGADDPESTHGTRGDIAQNVRLVAAPK